VRNVKEYPFPSSKSWAPLRPDNPEGCSAQRPAFPSSKSWAPLRLEGSHQPMLEPETTFPSFKSWASLRLLDANSGRP